MEFLTNMFLTAACAVFVYRELRQKRDAEASVLQAITNLNMTFKEFKAAAEAKFQSIGDAIEAEHAQVQEALTTLTATIEELREAVSGGGTPEEMEGLLSNLDGIVAGIKSVYVPPVVEETTEEETQE